MTCRILVASLIATVAVLTGCAVPMTQLGAVSLDDVRAEQLKQQELAIDWDLRQQQRVEDVGHALLAAATPFCSGAVVPRAGVRFANAYAFSADYQAAARALGFSDTLVVVGVARGSAAARAGFQEGDRVIALDDGMPPLGPNAIQSLARAMEVRRVPAPSVTLRHGSASFALDSVLPASAEAELRVGMPADTICGYNLVAVRKDDLNAWSDGTNVTVTSAMLRFAAEDDELATVLSHEIAHNAMRHIQAKQKNAALGGLFGALLDIAAATQGVNTQGQFTKQGMDAGAIIFSQDFEREADYVGMYLLARAGRSTARAPNFWRRMAQEDPKSIRFASTHPTSAERFVRLEQASREIEQKLARGEGLQPEMRGATPAVGATPSRSLASSQRRPAPAPTVGMATPPTSKAPAPSSGVPNNNAPANALTRPKVESAEMVAADPGVPGDSPTSTTTLSRVSKGDTASYTFGPAAPRNGLTVSQARRRAMRAFQDGSEAFEVRLYDQAEAKFRDAVLYDGGVARYHAALGELLLKRGKLAAAEAALSAAVLLDTENAQYRQLLAEARKRR
jgi:hypothetical protein